MYEEKIPYNNPNKWDQYLEKIIELHSIVNGLMNYYEKLKEELQERPLEEIIEKYKMVIFGGFYAEKEIPYSENALGRFYRDVIGIGISDNDARVIASRIREGIELKDAAKGIKIKTHETSVIELIKAINSILNDLIEKLGLPEKDPKNYGSNPSEGLVEAFKNLLEYSRGILPLYEPLSFFIQSLYSIPKFYLDYVYKEFNKSEVKTLLENKIGMEELIVILEPDISGPKREERTIYGLDTGSPPHMILETIYYIYELFRVKELEKYFSGVTDEFIRYMNAYKSRLERITRKYTSILDNISLYTSHECIPCPCKGHNFREPFIGTIVNQRDWPEASCAFIKVKGGEIALTYRDTVSWKYLQYSEFVTVMAPAMFVGLAQIREIGSKYSLGRHVFGWIPWTR